MNQYKNPMAHSVEPLSAICRNKILCCLEKKRFALKLLTKFFTSLIPYRLLLIELLSQFYTVENLRMNKQVKEDNQYEVLLRLEEKDPELILCTNQIWYNFTQTLEERYIEKNCANVYDDEFLNLLLHNANFENIDSSLKQKLKNKYQNTQSYKVFYLENVKIMKQKKLRATANIIKIQKDLQSERDSKSIVVLDSLEYESKKLPNRKITRSKLFQKSLNEHKTDIKKFKPNDYGTKTFKKKPLSSDSKPKIKRVKL